MPYHAVLFILLVGMAALLGFAGLAAGRGATPVLPCVFVGMALVALRCSRARRR